MGLRSLELSGYNFLLKLNQSKCTTQLECIATWPGVRNFCCYNEAQLFTMQCKINGEGVAFRLDKLHRFLKRFFREEHTFHKRAKRLWNVNGRQCLHYSAGVKFKGSEKGVHCIGGDLITLNRGVFVNNAQRQCLALGKRQGGTLLAHGKLKTLSRRFVLYLWNGRSNLLSLKFVGYMRIRTLGQFDWRASQNCAAGRIWPAGRSLSITAIEEESHTLIIQ